MNTLKPLLIVAVLAGIGYGVYVRLNRGNNGPPPVAEGWDTTPNVQLPDQSTGAPWSPPGAAAPGAGAPPFGAQAPAAGVPDGGAAPPFQAQSMAPAPPLPTSPGQAPPAAGATPPGQAPPYDATAGAAAAPPYGASAAPPFGADPATGAPPPGVEAAPPASPYDDPSAAAAAQPAPGANAALVDPYGESHDSGATSPYPASPGDGGMPADYAGGNPAGPDPQSADPLSAGEAGNFAAAFSAAQRELEGGQLAEALRNLSQWYDRPDLAPAEQQQLNALLDQVAGTVVYSTQNLIEPPHEVQPGERLEDIGDKYGVPWQLLAKINGIADPSQLRPGERLKVVRGPFQAVVNLQKRELTLFAADGLYAGRFKIGVGAEHPPTEGTFAVAEKTVNPVYYGRDRAIGAEDPQNPLGERWIGLGGGVGIHGTNNPQNIGRADLPGSISLSERDAEDVYDILSLGSRVTIRR